ncbi:tRNA-intron endonuclease [Haladaptatus litoreus]|uniref:tRNA-splicing endonuclease n=1 Tax=Haladaptatus litoreus TaxID=553468 RepID=A0A1N7C4N0_9EURY|nr:tRNA-intron lyase [Haladaptatus litoreus]SIR58530.1 tRNA-intron endonuclease [Haladaptatus litoreus]
MNGRLRDDEVVVGGDARQRYYDSRGYGRPLDGNEIALSRVEAAHLLLRDDLDSVEGMNFREFLQDSTGDDFAARFFVYADLRERGFYLSPDREGWVSDPLSDSDFVVYPRGGGPWDDEVLYRLRVASERETIPASQLGDVVLAVVDEESEITYFETDRIEISGTTNHDVPTNVSGSLLADRVLVWDAPDELHHQSFYGQPMGGRNPAGVLQLSLVEAAHLVAEGNLSVSGEYDEIVARGRDVEGERFDRRLCVYRALRETNVVPKTGFKFGADFRTYADVESVDNLGHSEYLIRVLEDGHAFSPRDLALDVRLAHGVRKKMIFALVTENERITDWLSVTRLTP